MSKNVMIPVNLFDSILDTFCALEPHVPDDLRNDVLYIVWDLNMKKHKMELRKAYSKIIAAKTGDERDWARIDYLRLKTRAEDSLF